MKAKILIGLLLVSALLLTGCTFEVNGDGYCSAICDGEYIEQSPSTVYCTSGNTNISSIGTRWSGLNKNVECS